MFPLLCCVRWSHCQSGYVDFGLNALRGAVVDHREENVKEDWRYRRDLGCIIPLAVEWDGEQNI